MVSVTFRHLANIRGREGAKGDKGDPGTIRATVEQVPADQPISVTMSGPETDRVAHFKVPLPPPGAEQVPTDEAIAGNLFNAATESGQGFKERVGYRVSVLAHGAVADGATDDYVAFQAALSEAGPEGIVYFPAKPGVAETVYMLSPTARRSLAGARIETDPGVVLRGRFEPDVKLWGAITDLDVDNLELQRREVKPKPLATPDPYAAAAAIIPDNAEPAALNFETWTPAGFGGGVAPYTVVPNGVTRTPTKVSWPTGFAGTAGYEGVTRVPEFGVMYTALAQTQTADGGMYVGAAVLSADLHIAGMRAAGASVTWEGFGSTAFMPILGSHTMNGLYGNPGTSGGVTVGIRAVDARTVEFYANGRLVSRRKLAKDIDRVAFVITRLQAANATLEYPMSYGRDYVPSSTHRIGTCSIIGDSISYKAWNTVGWDDLLPVALAGLPNGGHIQVRQNLSVSGSSVQDWAPGGSQDIGGHDFTGDRYVLVLLGTNDGALRDPQAFLDNLDAITAAIKADGATPIFGIFPFWSSSGLSGMPGAATSNAGRVQRLRQALAYWASTSSTGYEIALVQDVFGDNYNWLADNIHPTSFGQAAIARAFANAIARAEVKRLTA